MAAFTTARFTSCGVGDTLLPADRALHRELSELGIEHEYQEFAGGHESSYWREHIEDSFRFFARQLGRMKRV